MAELCGVGILILTPRVVLAQRWAEMLRGTGGEVWLAPAEVPHGQWPEVIVTDGNPANGGDLARSPTESPPAIASAAEAGTVRIGGAGPADVELPEDVTARELRLVCRLLAEIVRLRRREQSAAELCGRLSQQALTDPLTGLPNRRAWDQELAERLAAADTRRLCLAVFDLDHFKRINDAHGHGVGDEVLRSAGRAICDSLREDDFVARIGGDEFALLLWMPDESTAAAVVDRVRCGLPSRLAETGTHPVAASAGYHLAPPAESSHPMPSPDTFYATASAALQEAKRQGRGRTVGQ